SELGGPDQAKVVGVVMLTDGQHNWGPSPVARMIELKLKDRGIPVYPAALGSATPPPDAAVSRVDAPSSVYKGDTPTVSVTVPVSTLPARNLTVTLNSPEVDGKPIKPPLTETIEHDGNTPSYPVTFHPKLDRVGSQALTVKVEPQPEERFTDNNSR